MEELPILQVEQLRISFQKGGEATEAVKGVSFSLDKGQTLGIVGESGSGKSVSSLAIMGLLASKAHIQAERLQYQAKDGNSYDLSRLPEQQLRKLRGSELAMIFQEPMTSLNPIHTCGAQVKEAILQHQNVSSQAAKAQVLDWFHRVKLPRVQELYAAYPHEISGGQKQRVMIAMAMCCHPQVLIADEPTTALDVTVQRTILDLMLDLQAEFGTSLIFISHDLGVVGEMSDKILVLYKGEQVEYQNAAHIFTAATHPYTRGLLACRPTAEQRLHRLPTLQDYLAPEGDTPFSPMVVSDSAFEQRQELLQSQPPIMKVEGLKTYFQSRKQSWRTPATWVKAVDGVDLQIYPGETIGLVGESGCGKTTLGRTLLRLAPAHAGEVWYKDQPVLTMSSKEVRAWRKEVQMIFQDPYSSLNPRMTIGQAIAEPMWVHKLETSPSARKQQVASLLERVGLSERFMKRYPHELSGGQRQRVCIARALAVSPQFIVCDESVSALDVSVQAMVLNLLKDLQDEFGLTYLFISHDLSVVRFISDRILVMNAGKIVEQGYSEDLYQRASHPYTQELLSAIPASDWDAMKQAKEKRKSTAG